MIVPITDYAQSANSPSALRNRLLKYLIPVILISFLFNGPKFFEARVGYSNSTVVATPSNETLTNLTLSDGTMNTLLEQESIEWTPYVSTKGQLISKGHFSFFNSPKKRTKIFCFSRLGQKFKFSSSFFGKIGDTKKTFWN